LKKSSVNFACGLLAVSALVLFAGVALALGFPSKMSAAAFVLCAVGAAGLVASLVLMFRLRKGEALTSAKYARKKSIVTPCELDFLKTLRRISPEKYEVLPQAVLLSVIDKRTETAYRNELFRVIDYVFVDRISFAPLLLVELNDRSHLRADRKLRDEKVREICDKAKLPLVTFTTDEIRSFDLVRKRVLSEILKR
jgi:hypothetical protein